MNKYVLFLLLGISSSAYGFEYYCSEIDSGLLPLKIEGRSVSLKLGRQFTEGDPGNPNLLPPGKGGRIFVNDRPFGGTSLRIPDAALIGEDFSMQVGEWYLGSSGSGKSQGVAHCRRVR